MDLSEKILASGNLTEAYDAIMNAIGMGAWRRLEDMMLAQEVRERRSVERELTPYSVMDVDLLKRLLPAARALSKKHDPMRPEVRLADLISNLEELLDKTKE
jgi:hypothetical protein